MKNWHWFVLGTLLLVSLIIEFTMLADYDSHWWNNIPAFYAIWGFVVCVVIIFFAKWISKLFISRNKNYYDG